ncbi:hypothetical protein [Chryseobacterium potabilaquae]|uniref:Uncharacterized protein n=1 Tax=Chryseobacterium potabilaquae TaxID=2675057 RepID=A0A6N4X730_9FLAO|nr:hypothetical protein [Chryseobacterium potabilaquae]CAA7195236.1 hypothetical protein CHRY9293_01465 [Chryseobacterium potabilaquae]
MYEYFLRLQNNPYARRIYENYYTSGRRGSPVMQWIRQTWAARGFNIFNRYHYYEYTTDVGLISEGASVEGFYNYMAYGPIYRTVPYSIIGGNNGYFGDRINDGRATAGGLGPVQTLNFDSTAVIQNVAMPGHFLNPGTVTITVFRDGDRVRTRFVGQGNGNFAWLNEVFGNLTFQAVMRNNIRGYRNR